MSKIECHAYCSNFEEKEHEVEGLYFSRVVDGIKQSKKFCRSGWDGEYIYLKKRTDGIMPCICRFEGRDMDGREIHQPGWLPSHEDILADDWCEFGRA
jgi:hypothetical protein